MLDALSTAADPARSPGGEGGQDNLPHGALLYCDRDVFKSISDTHGQAFGDQVLCIVAARLTE